MMLEPDFFDRDTQIVARDLLGKVIRHHTKGAWLAARIIETEAYYLHEKGSHASLGRTPSREALFMPPGTIYMYYARGGDSLNFSCRGEGNAVLIKSAFPFFDGRSPEATTRPVMEAQNPLPSGEIRRPERLMRGQTLLCKALGLRVPDWDRARLHPEKLVVEDVGDEVSEVLIARRLGIPTGRDEHLMYRFIAAEHTRHACQNPLTSRRFVEGRDFRREKSPEAQRRAR